jgi:16S rRNA (cytosine967-C5)-methyltransferase
MSDAREIATHVLHRVDVDAAYAAAVLSAELASPGIDPRDAALATEIVYGALRSLPSLDRVIRDSLSDPTKKLDPWVRATFRVAAYQILHLERVPVHAAVDRAVGIATAKRGRRLGGFVNAVLRRVAEKRPAEPKPPTTLEVPPWLERMLASSLGAERATAFLAGRRLPPPIGLRARLPLITRDELRERILNAHPKAEAADGVSPESLLLRGASNPRMLPGYAGGFFSIQEEGAQLVLGCISIAPGARVADVCAGRGGKALAALERVGDDGAVFAFDIDERKLEEIPKEQERLRLGGVLECEPVDFSVGTGGHEDSFDVVLVDAPCSGLGTVHRRPEVLLRVTEKDPARMAALQSRILKNAARLVRPGGVLLFAVCSPTAAEGAGVVHAFTKANPVFRPEPILPSGPLSADADGIARIGPWMAESDAYQVAVWRRDS